MTKFHMKSDENKAAFTLVEVLVSLTIAALILITLFSIYARINSVEAAINKRYDENAMAQEILQRIAEDIDRFGLAKENATINFQSKFEKGHRVARLTMENHLYADRKQKRSIFEKVVWQSAYDPEINDFVLYRAHSGITYEDKLLEGQKTEAERELFIPLCSGVTYFKIEALQGLRVMDRWYGTSGQMPPAVVVTISFAESFESPTGGFDVPEDKKITRTIAVDRARKITFIPPEIPEEEEKEEEESP